MNYLLDTCALLHLANSPERLSPKAREAVMHLDSPLFISVVTAGELACLTAKNKALIPRHWRGWLDFQIEERGLNVLSIDLKIMSEAWSLPETDHRDSADRIIIATARVNNLTVITTDRLILDYPHVQSLA
jgi:PIN domain nuclease of toxin-antitoxin system